jgi:hypothetical protein
MPKDINILLDELINLGEDEEEMRLWRELYPTMNKEFQDKLLNQLSEEKQKLESLKKT